MKLNKYPLLLYSVAVLVAATLYAYFCGGYTSLIPVAVWLNALLSTATMGSAVWFLRRMNQYGMPRYVQFILSVVWNLGVEAAVMNLFLAAGEFPVYLDSLWLRAFILILYALLFLLWEARATQAQAAEEAQQALASAQKPPTVPTAVPVATIDRVSVRMGNTLKIIPCTDLLYLKAEGDYVNLVTTEGRWLKEQTLKSFQESLPQMHFVRVHRSYLVNITAISRIERYGEQHLILLKNGEQIQISTSGYKALRSVLNL